MFTSNFKLFNNDISFILQTYANNEEKKDVKMYLEILS